MGSGLDGRWVGLAMVLGLGCAAPGAWAQACGDRPTQADMNDCAGAAYRRADAALNDAYRRVTARAASVPRQLVAAQKAWLAYRDAECGFETALYEGGSVRPFLAAQCLEGMTRQRTSQFEAWLRCKEGDLSCPLPPR